MVSLENLENRHKVISDLEQQQEAIAQKINEEKKAIDADLKRFAASYGYKLVRVDESKSSSEKPSRKPARIKYRDNDGNTWTGRGMTPRWLTAAEANGQSRDTFLV